MLVMLTPEQISSHWEAIKLSLNTSIRGEVPNRMNMPNNVLQLLLSGMMQCWLSYRNGEDGHIIEGFLLTQVVDDGITGNRNLLIYAVHTSHNNAVRESFLKAVDTLKKFGKSNGCQGIVGFTDSESIVTFVTSVGGSFEYFVNIPCEVQDEDLH